MDTFEDSKKKGKVLSDELQDTQNKVDVRNISISRVGIKDIKYPFANDYKYLQPKVSTLQPT